MNEYYAKELKEAEQFKDNMINFIECVKQDAPLQSFYLDKILEYIDDVHSAGYLNGLETEDKDRLRTDMMEHLTIY